MKQQKTDVWNIPFRRLNIFIRQKPKILTLNRRLFTGNSDVCFSVKIH